MRLSSLILRMFGWTVDITVPDIPKAIIAVAPHTSNWDFIIGKLAYASVGRKAGFLMKEGWFFFPMNLIFKAMGGIPVPSKRGSGSVINTVVGLFKSRSKLVIAITPEGTRSRTDKWHTGFLTIARQADVPILLGAIDFMHKCVIIDRQFSPTGDDARDLRSVKDYFSQFTGKYPEKFSTSDAQ